MEADKYVFKKDNTVPAVPALQTQSEAHKAAAQKRDGSFRYTVESVAPEFEQTLANINEALALYEQREETLLYKLKVVMGINEVGFWEVQLANHEFADPQNIVIIEPSLKKMLGYREDELMNGIVDLQQLVPPEQDPILLSTLNAHFHDVTGTTPFDVQHCMRFGDGEYRWVHTFGTAIRSEQGKPVRLIATVMNIHDKKVNEEELQNVVTRYDLINESLVESP